MSDSIEPIDPATCEPDRWYLVRALGGHERAGLRLPRGAWYVPGETPATYEDGDGRLTVVAELVRADEAQQVAEWLIAENRFVVNGEWFTFAEMRTDRDKWKSWHAGAINNTIAANQMVERLRAEKRKAKKARDRLRAECEKAQAERDEAREKLNYEREAKFMDALNASAVDPDPTSASRLPELPERTDDNAPLLRYAADIMERTNGVAPCIRESIAALRQRASNLEAVAAREQERDAEIAVVVSWFPDTIGYSLATRFAASAIDDLDAHRKERGES